jgi:hypothetical protein
VDDAHHRLRHDPCCAVDVGDVHVGAFTKRVGERRSEARLARRERGHETEAHREPQQALTAPRIARVGLERVVDDVLDRDVERHRRARLEQRVEGVEVVLRDLQRGGGKEVTAILEVVVEGRSPDARARRDLLHADGVRLRLAETRDAVEGGVEDRVDDHA